MKILTIGVVAFALLLVLASADVQAGWGCVWGPTICQPHVYAPWQQAPNGCGANRVYYNPVPDYYRPSRFSVRHVAAIECTVCTKTAAGNGLKTEVELLWEELRKLERRIQNLEDEKKK